MASLTVRRAVDAADVAAVAALFREYQVALVASEGPPAAAHVCFQDFEAELADLASMYGAPRGALLLAEDAARPLGCVGVRPAAEQGACEMKRLYLRPEARATGTGRRLAEAALEAARDLGYRKMVLDTLPSMRVAIGLYRAMGFQTRSPYDEGAQVGTIYLERTL